MCGSSQPKPLGRRYFSESLRHLTQLSDYRRSRLFTSHARFRGAVAIAGFGGVLLIAFSYSVGQESVWSQAAMVGALAGILACSLFLIKSLDNPYSGVTRVTRNHSRSNCSM